MSRLVSEVHLFIAIDPQISPGPILQSLDYFRVKEWQQETVLICDVSWRPYVNIDQPVIFLDKGEFYSGSTKEVVNTDILDHLLEQLDSFEISNITQIGELSWGRWLQAYLQEIADAQYIKIDWNKNTGTSIQLINDVAEELAIDLSAPLTDKPRSSAIYIDPYDGHKLSKKFVDLIQNKGSVKLPEWLNVIVKNKDHKLFSHLNIEENLVDFSESEMNLFNQFVLCFSDSSSFALTSRSYSVALFDCESDQSLFVQGDITINPQENIHFSELLNILSYWKAGRLKELAFQWFNMGIDIHSVEFFHSRIVKRNLLNYSSDLHHCQTIVDNFVRSHGKMTNLEIVELIRRMRKNINNDPYSLSFSLKILIMITERMLASGSCGERLFQRLGSDYHRIIIGEALIEGLIGVNSHSLNELDITKQLKLFLKFLVAIDFRNDQTDKIIQSKES